MIRGQWNEVQWKVAITAQCEPPVLTGSWKISNLPLLGGWEIFKTARGGPVVGDEWGVKNNWGDASNSIHRVSGRLIPEFLELFCTFFDTENQLQKVSFFRLVLQLFLNSEFLTINLLGYSIHDCSLFGSPLCDEIFQFCQRQPQ